MEITTENDITPAAIRVVRRRTGLPQHAFWGALGLSQSAGSMYEKGAQPIPAPTRTLLFIKYVAGLDFDASTEEGASRLRDLAAHQRQQHISSNINAAMALVKQAAGLLSNL